VAAAIAIEAGQCRIAINITNTNAHQPESGLRIRLQYKFRRCQGRAVGGVIAGQCGAIVNTLKGLGCAFRDSDMIQSLYVPDR
jgi:hypothetical protein